MTLIELDSRHDNVLCMTTRHVTDTGAMDRCVAKKDSICHLYASVLGKLLQSFIYESLFTVKNDSNI